MSHSPLARSILITRSFAPPRDAPTVMSGDTNIERRTAEFLAGFRGLKKRRPSLVALVPTDPDYEEAVDKWDDDRLSLDDDDDDGDDDGDDDEGDDDDENDDLATIQRKIARLAAEEDANRKHINETKRRIWLSKRRIEEARRASEPETADTPRAEADASRGRRGRRGQRGQRGRRRVEADTPRIADESRPSYRESPISHESRATYRESPTSHESLMPHESPTSHGLRSTCRESPTSHGSRTTCRKSPTSHTLRVTDVP